MKEMVTTPPGGTDGTKIECKSLDPNSNVIPITTIIMILLNCTVLSFIAMIKKEIPKNIPVIWISEFIRQLKSACPMLEGILFVPDSIILRSKFKIDT